MRMQPLPRREEKTHDEETKGTHQHDPHMQMEGRQTKQEAEAMWIPKPCKQEKYEMKYIAS